MGAEVDASVERRALDARAQLARTGQHRLPPVDVLIAALADRHQLDVLHYDADYDVIAGRTDLAFQSVWLGPRGRLQSTALAVGPLGCRRGGMAASGARHQARRLGRL